MLWLALKTLKVWVEESVFRTSQFKQPMFFTGIFLWIFNLEQKIIVPWKHNNNNIRFFNCQKKIPCNLVPVILQADVTQSDLRTDKNVNLHQNCTLHYKIILLPFKFAEETMMVSAFPQRACLQTVLSMLSSTNPLTSYSLAILELHRETEGKFQIKTNR